MTDPVVQERAANFAREAAESAHAADELRRSVERFRTLSTAAPIGIYETDARGRCLYTNPRFQEMAGLTLEESLEDGYLRAIHPEDRPRVAEAQRTAAAEGKALSVEFRFLTPTGEAR